MAYPYNWYTIAFDNIERGERAMKEAFVKFVLSILPTIMDLVTPEIREMIEEFMLRWWEKAKATPNPIDDVIVKFIALLIKVDLP